MERFRQFHGVGEQPSFDTLHGEGVCPVDGCDANEAMSLFIEGHYNEVRWCVNGHVTIYEPGVPQEASTESGFIKFYEFGQGAKP
jgi:hypothetical protein